MDNAARGYAPTKLVATAKGSEIYEVLYSIAGTEEERLSLLFERRGPCGEVEAGNEAEGGTGEFRRFDIQVTERRTRRAGGVGGVAIHVGGENSVRTDDLGSVSMP